MINKKLDNLAAVLTDLGLSENESRVYLASLSTGPAPILAISQAADMKRTTVYSVVEYLKNKGLMRIELRGDRKLFTAEHPDKLKSMIRLKEEVLEQSMPDILDLYNLKKNEGFIKYYEGVEAIKNVYNGLIRDVKPGDDYLIVSNYDDWYNVDPEFFASFWERRARLDIKVRILLEDTPSARALQMKEKRQNHTIKLFPHNTRLSTNQVTTPQKTVIHQLTDPIFALVIENKSIIQMNTETFEIMWNSIL